MRYGDTLADRKGDAGVGRVSGENGVESAVAAVCARNEANIDDVNDRFTDSIVRMYNLRMRTVLIAEALGMQNH